MAVLFLIINNNKNNKSQNKSPPPPCVPGPWTPTWTSPALIRTCTSSPSPPLLPETEALACLEWSARDWPAQGWPWLDILLWDRVPSSQAAHRGVARPAARAHMKATTSARSTSAARASSCGPCPVRTSATARQSNAWGYQRAGPHDGVQDGRWQLPYSVIIWLTIIKMYLYWVGLLYVKR